MTFGKFLLYVVLIGAGLLGLVASVCGAIFATSAHGSERPFAIFVLCAGVAIVVGVVVGFRALGKPRDPPPP